MSRRRHRPPPSAGPAPLDAGRRYPTPWRAAGAVIVAGVTFLAYAGVLGHGFLNWDDPDVLLRNSWLEGQGVVGWAFSTTHISHYQPLSWLTWAALRRLFGPDPLVHHLTSLVAHLLNAGLVYLLAWRLATASLSTSSPAVAAFAAALVFAVHPMRVEPVAWASGLPYLLALAPLLLATLAYVSYATGAPPRAIRLVVAAAGYLVSLLFRPVALGFPLVLLLLDAYLGRIGSGTSRRRLLFEKLPFAALAVAAAAVEASARPLVALERMGLGTRLADAALAPFIYLWRTLAPVGLSPLDPLSLDARTSWPALGGAFLLLGTVSAIVARHRGRRPGLFLAWLAYLALLGPVLGLAPSGLQATADRYTYLPCLVLALVVGDLVSTAWESRWRPLAVALAAAIGLALTAATVCQVRYWRDSVTLWTRAVEIDAGNDVALYNLASALAESGDAAAATERYEQLLRLIPHHRPALANLGLLQAKRLEAQANELAAAGRLREAVELYGRALERDPARLHSRASRGMALMTLGRFAEAVPDLERAIGEGRSEPPVAGALGFALLEVGRPADARRVLEQALTAEADDVGLAHNLARLLATAEDPAVRDEEKAVRLATTVVERTSGRDPRALDTLAVAQAAAGRLDLAAATAEGAEAEARKQGHRELAAALERRARAYRQQARQEARQ